MVLSENTIYTRWFKHSRNPVKQTPSSKALILLIGPTEKRDKTATHDHCLLKVKIWVVYPTFSAESCEGLVGVKRKRTKKEREKIEKKKGERKEGREKKTTFTKQKQFLQVWNPRFFACQEKSLPLHKLDKQNNTLLVMSKYSL